MQIFKPKSSSYLIEILGWFQGKPAEFTNAVETLNKGNGREVTRVENAGIVKVQFTIAAQNMEALGFQGISN